ncbi:type II secretion system protein [Wansuia hejianensis]|uniref:Type II secretion system protein n=1 Tax=Wansuia hejianensis TaxID=2763667 RepID=A0A926EZL0_9FIRM|nr:type II secretion system protein [Wansuia hejianensis]MBC8590586.1 type II secretion system protein [Wansuia hejianensis]
MGDRKAYTLIELILVLALLFIIVAMTIPNTNFYLSIAKNQELKELKKDLLFARNKAIIESQVYIVSFDSKDNRYIIKTKKKSSPIKVKKLEHGIKLNEEISVKSIYFLPSGATENSNTIYLQDKNKKKYEVTITPVTGRVEIKIIE